MPLIRLLLILHMTVLEYVGSQGPCTQRLDGDVQSHFTQKKLKFLEIEARSSQQNLDRDPRTEGDIESGFAKHQWASSVYLQ